MEIKTINNIFSKAIFLIYIGILLWAITFKCNLLNVVEETYIYYGSMTIKERFKDVLNFKVYFSLEEVLNILIFIPLGLYCSTIFLNKNKCLKTIFISFSLSFLLEMFQFFSLIGGFSWVDIFTNVLGGILGYLLYFIFYNKFVKYKYGLLIVYTISLILMLPIITYGIVNTIKNFSFYVDVLLRRL